MLCQGTWLCLRRTLPTPSQPCGVGSRVSSLCESLLPWLSEGWPRGVGDPCHVLPAQLFPRGCKTLLIWGVAWMAQGECSEGKCTKGECSSPSPGKVQGAGHCWILQISPRMCFSFGCQAAGNQFSIPELCCTRVGCVPGGCSLLPRAMSSSGSTDTPCRARQGDSRDHVLPLVLGKFCTDPGA